MLVNIVLPEISADEITCGLRTLVEHIYPPSSAPYLGGTYGYGAEWDSEIFRMRPFCWCEREECPWCVSCTCDFIFTLDGKDVSYEDYIQAYDEAMAGMEFGTPAYTIAIDALNLRRGTRKPNPCEFCRTGGAAATEGGGPGRAAPNFWHKPSGLKVLAPG